VRKKKLLASLGFAWGALSLIVGPASAVTGTGSGSASATSTAGGQATAVSADVASAAVATPGSAGETTCSTVALGVNGESESVGGCNTHTAP